MYVLCRTTCLEPIVHSIPTPYMPMLCCNSYPPRLLSLRSHLGFLRPVLRSRRDSVSNTALCLISFLSMPLCCVNARDLPSPAPPVLNGTSHPDNPVRALPAP
jgi:hypothetical protein